MQDSRSASKLNRKPTLLCVHKFCIPTVEMGVHHGPVVRKAFSLNGR